MNGDHRYLVPREYAQRLGVDQKKVLAWIKSGELTAVDVSLKRGGQPRWKINPDDAAAFEQARSSKPPAPKSPRGRKPKRLPDVEEFY